MELFTNPNDIAAVVKRRRRGLPFEDAPSESLTTEAGVLIITDVGSNQIVTDN